MNSLFVNFGQRADRFLIKLVSALTVSVGFARHERASKINAQRVEHNFKIMRILMCTFDLEGKVNLRNKLKIRPMHSL